MLQHPPRPVYQGLPASPALVFVRRSFQGRRIRSGREARQGRRADRWEHFLVTFDAGKNGTVTVEEWNEKRAKGFDLADKNKDRFIDKDEFVSGGRELGTM